MSGKIWHLEIFSKKIFFFDFFFNLTLEDRLVKEQGCMYGGMNGANSDNAVSIQKMVNQITFTLLHGDKGHALKVYYLLIYRLIWWITAMVSA